MREWKNGKTVNFEERPVILPAILIAAALLLAAFATGLVQGGDFTSGEIEWAPLLAALAMMGGGLFFLRRERFAFDTFRKQLRWSKVSVFGRSNGTVPFSDIEDVLIDESRDSDGSTYRLVLRTKGGLLPMTAAFYGSRSTWEGPALRIRGLLGLKAPEPLSLIRTMILDGRIIDAVKHIRAERQLDLATAKGEVDRLRKEMGL